MSLLVISKILKLFVNTLTADHKYSLRNSRNLPQQIPMQLSKKQKLFFYDYASFLKFTSNFELFEEKHDAHSLCSFNIRDSKKRGYLNVQKAPFQKTFRQSIC